MMLRILALALLPLALAEPGLGQARMTRQYDSCVSYSMDADTNLIVYQTVVVEGTTTGSCSWTVVYG